MIHTHTFEIGGKTLSIESGRVAKQAGGSVLLGMGETVVLGTATMSQKPRDLDFLPLVCDFEERKYSIGKIPGGFIKRGGRPSERATLTSRLIDRPIRPLFPKGMRHDLQVVAMAFSVDKECPPDVLGICAAGAALAVSDIPFDGPIAGVRVGHIDGEFVLCPSNEQLKESKIDLIVAGHKGAISMVEAGADEVSEELILEALGVAHDAIKLICAEFEKFAKKAGKPTREVELRPSDDELVAEIEKSDTKSIASGLFNADKAKREAEMAEAEAAIIAKYEKKYSSDEEKLGQIKSAVGTAVKNVFRNAIIKDGKRPDGRKPDEIRDMEAVAGILPRVHGSGLFTRGQTQVMTVLTLGMPKDAQMVDSIDESVSEKKYMHFYNFPPYSVGEVRMMRGPGRREVGHGALAERALLPVVPIGDEDFPYTCLLMSEVLESNGSSSMASVCGSSLALMDAGVPIKATVAGVAMGLISDGKTFRILTDIQGLEDHAGDMDFKVAGTRAGITALQLDTKLKGIPDQVLKDALAQAKEARLKIIDVMEEEIPAPRSELSPTAPRVQTHKIEPEKIGALIGPGGANIRKITEETGCEIDVQQDGTVLIASQDSESAALALTMVKACTASIEVGMEFSGKVTRLMGRGAMVEMPGGRDGMVPTDMLTEKEIRRPDDAVEIGDVINVRVGEIDDMGRVNLTALGLNPDHERINNPVATSGPGGRDGGRGGRGGPRRDGGGRGGRDRNGGRGRSRSEGEDVNARFRPRR